MLAVVAMAAFSCAKVSEDIDNVPKDESSSKTKVITITAEPDDDVLPDTKTSLSGVSIIWNDLDKVAGYDTVHDKVISDVTTVTDEGKKATFSFEAPLETESFYYLVYPATACGAGDDSEVEVTVPTNQTATANSFAPGANIAFAEVPTDVSKVKFMNIGGLISFIIHNDNISSVEFSANEVMTGIGSVDVNTGVATPGAGNKKVIVNGGLTNGNTYYAVIYPGTYTGLKIEVTNTSGQVATYTNSTPLTIARNGNLFIAELTIPDGKWVTPTKGSSITWNLNSGDLGTTGSPASSVTKGSPSTLTWTPAFTWSTATKYFGNDGTKGVQIGSNGNPCTKLVLSTSDYSQYVESVKINFSEASSGDEKVSVKVADEDLLYSGNKMAEASNSAVDYIFSTASLLKGDIEITFTNGSAKAFYIKSIVINPVDIYLTTSPSNGQTIEWEDDESGVSYAETITVSQNYGATGYTLNYTDAGDEWTVSDNTAGTITVYPKSDNDSSSDDKTLTITITHKDDKDVKSVVTLKQKKVPSAYSSTYTTSSNVTVSSDENKTVKIGGVDYNAYKTNKGSSVSITIPANTKTVHLFIAAWNGEGQTVSITNGSIDSSSITADSAISGSSGTYTLTGTISNYYRKITPSSTSTTSITIKAASNKRIVVWGVNEESN